MSENKEKLVSQMVTLENMRRIMLSGIKEVVSQIDKCVVAKTGPKTVSILGSSLRVTKLNLDEGVLVVEGNIEGFKYSDSNGSKGFFKRLFK